jgi:hypothetical protein
MYKVIFLSTANNMYSDKAASVSVLHKYTKSNEKIAHAYNNINMSGENPQLAKIQLNYLT